MSENKSKLQPYTDIILGTIAVVLSIIALLYPEITIAAIIFVTSIALFILSLPRIIGGIFLNDLPNGLRILNVISGSIALFISIIALVYPNLATQALIYLLSLGLLLIGTVRLTVGVFFKIFPSWIRTLFVIAGSFTLLVGILTFIFPEFGFSALVLLISISLLTNGIIRIIQGLTKPI